MGVINDLACGHGVVLLNGDGVKTVVQTGLPRKNPPQLWRKGSWDGQQRLYASARTNLAKNSQAFNLWTKSTSSSVATDTVVAPDGTTTADAFTGGTSDSNIQDTNLAVSAGVQYCGSVWMKVPSGTQTVEMVVGDGAGGYFHAPKTVTSVWQRFSVTGTNAGGAGATARLQLGGFSSIGTGVVVHVWGAQLEAGSVPTPYMPAGASPVTVTDYALSGTQATLTSAPAAGTMIYRRTKDQYGVRL